MIKPANVGRMGNFLFQAACAMSYAWKHDIEFTLPDTTNDAKSNPIYLQHLVDPGWRSSLPEVLIGEKTHAYHELPFHEEWRWRNIILKGYWQSEKYFKEYRERLLKAFGFPWRMKEKCVSVHVRRTDYLTVMKRGKFKHPPVSKEWYLKCMTSFPDHKFIFFSDDIAWCRANFGDRKDCEFSTGNVIIDHCDTRPEVQDLIMGSWCEHHICSASTFSWWQAWLNQNPEKRVMIPNHWFSPGWGGLVTDDIVPIEWEKVA